MRKLAASEDEQDQYLFWRERIPFKSLSSRGSKIKMCCQFYRLAVLIRVCLDTCRITIQPQVFFYCSAFEMIKVHVSTPGALAFLLCKTFTMCSILTFSETFDLVRVRGKSEELQLLHVLLSKTWWCSLVQCWWLTEWHVHSNAISLSRRTTLQT